MKHYTKPIATVAKYAFNEHITAASGSVTCQWTTEYQGNLPEQVNDAGSECHKHGYGDGQYQHLIA